MCCVLFCVAYARLPASQPRHPELKYSGAQLKSLKAALVCHSRSSASSHFNARQPQTTRAALAIRVWFWTLHLRVGGSKGLGVCGSLGFILLLLFLLRRQPLLLREELRLCHLPWRHLSLAPSPVASADVNTRILLHLKKEGVVTSTQLVMELSATFWEEL